MAKKKKDDFVTGTKLKDALKKKTKSDIVFMISPDSATDVERFISTGCTELDFKIANRPNGGIPIGKITEVSGQEATGKSLLAMQVMANAQKEGGLAVYVDPEYGLNTDFAMRVGLDVSHDSFIHITPTCVDEVFHAFTAISELLHDLEVEAKSEKREPDYKFAVVVWDSVPSTPTKHDRDDQNPDPTATIGLKARFLGKNVPTLLSLGQKKKIAFVFINQLRMKIGAMPGQDPWITPGGKAIPYYASLRLRISSVGKLKDNDNTIFGIKTRVKVVKNRFGPPHRTADFPLYFTHGIDDEESMMEILEQHKKLRRRVAGRLGSQYSWKDEKNDTEMNKVSFKDKLLNDPSFKQKALKLMEECLVKDMSDPRQKELVVVSDEELDKGIGS